MSSPQKAEAVEVFTDGACSGNPGPGGWAWASRDGRQASGGEPETTNQRMELRAVLEALRAVAGPLVIRSDSTYVVNGINERWYEGWKARGWKNSQRKPVANRDLWEPLIDTYLERCDLGDEVSFIWVKGHSGNPMNDLVDGLAVAEAAAQRETVAEAAAQRETVAGGGGGGGPEVPWPVDRAVAVTGPGELDDEQQDGLGLAIDGLDPDHDILVSGLRRGAELEAAELALARQVPLAVVLPYPDPAARWPSRSLDRFRACVDAAHWLVTLDGDPATPSKAVARRDRWVWSAVVGAILIGRPDLVETLEGCGLGVIEVGADG